MGEINFLDNFYKTAHTRESLPNSIDVLFGVGAIYQVRAFPCYINNILQDKLLHGGFRFINPQYIENGIALFKHEYHMKRNEEIIPLEEWFFIMASQEYKDIFTVITFGNSFYFNKYLITFFNREYPNSSLTFITHKKLQNLLINFKSKNQIERMIITRASLRTRVEGKTIPIVSWPSMTLEKAFEWVEYENGWFQRITLKAFLPLIRKELEVSISRQGVIRTNASFSSIYFEFLYPTERVIFRNVKIFSNRARFDNEQRNVRPLYIDFGTDVFSDKEENMRFIQSLKKMKSSDTSVIHGNPYVNLSIIDYFDGSIYDIWMLKPSQIIIIPQMKSSHQALKRLINHIFDFFLEGNILESP